MRESFRGWRRKIGVATLAMALLLTVGWVRSVTIDEGVSFRTGKFTEMFLGSGPSGFVVAPGKYSDASFPSLNAGWSRKRRWTTTRPKNKATGNGPVGDSSSERVATVIFPYDRSLLVARAPDDLALGLSASQ